jgi:hypothetical protein
MSPPDEARGEMRGHFGVTLPDRSPGQRASRRVSQRVGTAHGSSIFPDGDGWARTGIGYVAAVRQVETKQEREQGASQRMHGQSAASYPDGRAIELRLGGVRDGSGGASSRHPSYGPASVRAASAQSVPVTVRITTRFGMITIRKAAEQRNAPLIRAKKDGSEDGRW